MPDLQSKQSEGQPGLVPAALFGLCPQCGARSLFAGAAKFAPGCSACGQDFSRFNVGDGPAAFLTMVLGAVVLGLALWVEFTFHPPVWVHVVLWVPLTAGATLWGLRVGKAALLAAEFKRHAAAAGAQDLKQD
ncbi:DUF983 domain-containing protein [Novosphingobium sp. B 225]|uniref:DUF983 domain-containing protein n=1 Tax=Novosphingobium sp. B 225 TaxID=1961849 RepID=UPI000B4AE186|nr:DUF983 domain-containing protein [Novosphingobium sp. B 225]